MICSVLQSFAWRGQELAYVLKALNPTKFDEASVDCLMAAKGADSVHIEDFVSWVFEAVECTAAAPLEKAASEAKVVGGGGEQKAMETRMVSDEERGLMIGDLAIAHKGPFSGGGIDLIGALRLR